MHRCQAAVAVIVETHKYLTITRSQTVRAPGLVCFPGGGVEHGETIAEALVREMNEELNIDVLPGKEIWKSIASSGVELNWWSATLKPGQSIIPNPAEVENFLWLPSEEIINLPNLLPSNAEFFRALKREEFQIWN